MLHHATSRDTVHKLHEASIALNDSTLKTTRKRIAIKNSRGSSISLRFFIEGKVVEGSETGGGNQGAGEGKWWRRVRDEGRSQW